MPFIVIEKLGGIEYAIICMDKDGNNEVFDSEGEAQDYADAECQDGIVVPIDEVQ